MSNGGSQFGLPKSYLSDIENVSINEIYSYVSKNKGSGGDNLIQKKIREAPFFTDKTPEYFFFLNEVVDLTNGLDIPVIAIVKDFDSYLYSLARRGSSRPGIPIPLSIEAMRDIPSSVYMFKYENYLKNPNIFISLVEEIVYRHNPNLDVEKLSLEKFEQKIGDEYYPYNNWEKGVLTDAATEIKSECTYTSEELSQRIKKFEHFKDEYSEFYDKIICYTEK
jgi:hypothetical protein